MHSNIKPGKPARLSGAITTPALIALITAKRRGQALEPVMTKIMQEIGFDSFMYGMSDNQGPLRKDFRTFVWTTLPLAWVKCYGENGYIEVDPRSTETYARNVPLVWDADDYKRDARCSQFFAAASRFGVCSGVCVSFRDPDHGRIVVAFNSRVTPVSPERKAMIAGQLGELMLFAVSFHDFFMAHFVDHNKALMTRVAPLTQRERHCLELAANGMTSRDIGLKLGSTERTVNFHAHNMIRKMGVLNRKEAIAVAIARGWVRLDDASINSGDHRIPTRIRR
jgi:DNA-binding CsgD family transcriptional regulator